MSLPLSLSGLMLYTARLWRATVQLAREARETAQRQGEGMGKSLAIANISAEAAKQSARAAEETLIVPQRAYMCSKEYRAIASKEEGGHTIKWKFTLILGNAGNTPAIEFHAGIILQGVLRDGQNELGLFDFTNLEDPAIAVVGPKNSIGCNGKDGKDRLTLSQVARILSGEIDVFLCGAAKYRDIFPQTPPRRTLVCMKLSVEDRSLKSATPFGYNAHHKYNEVT